MSNQIFSEKLKAKRNKYGISQNKLAVIAGVSCHYLSDVETGKITPSKEKQKLLTDGLEKLNPDSPLALMFDYVRIRFPTLDFRYIIEEVLQIKLKHFIHEDYGFYIYSHFNRQRLNTSENDLCEISLASADLFA